MDNMTKLILCMTLAVGIGQAFPQNSGSVLIVGGEPAQKNEIPYQIALFYMGSQWCGGSILNAKHVVTAAHCVGSSNNYYSVRAGEHDLTLNEGTEQRVFIRETFIHEGYGSGIGTNANDIAILRLLTPLNFTESVRSIALPVAGHISTGIVQTSGWGALSYGGPSPDVLYKVRVPIVDDLACAESYEAETPFTINGELMVCAGHMEEGGQDSCNGDSGGPLVAYDNGEYLAGIVSWGEECARPRFPGVYTEVLPYLNWINEIINESV